jgi:hypothetical protein
MKYVLDSSVALKWALPERPADGLTGSPEVDSGPDFG